MSNSGLQPLRSLVATELFALIRQTCCWSSKNECGIVAGSAEVIRDQ